VGIHEGSAIGFMLQYEPKMIKTFFSSVILIFLTTVIHIQNVSGSEIDSYNVRNIQLPDTLAVLNIECNRRIDLVLSYLNDKKITNEAALYRHLSWALGGNVGSKMQFFLEKNSNVAAWSVMKNDSIYKEMNSWTTPALKVWSRLGRIINVNNVYIGTDKIGHALGQGYSYFKIAYLQNGGITRALAYGEMTEKTYYGYTSTGIYSYADLVANFQGMRFWIHILYKYPDPLDSHAPGPYVALKDNSWIRLRNVDWAYYIDPAWDESCNQSIYRDERIAQKIIPRIEDTKERIGRKKFEICKTAAQKLVERYYPFHEYLFNKDIIYIADYQGAVIRQASGAY